jgi:hypothetical protein
MVAAPKRLVYPDLQCIEIQHNTPLYVPNQSEALHCVLREACPDKVSGGFICRAYSALLACLQFGVTQWLLVLRLIDGEKRGSAELL